MLTAQASTSAAAAKASFEKTCTSCHKTYYSENAYQNHLGSQKHRLRVAALQSGERTLGDDEANSVLGSTISLGDPISTSVSVIDDPEAEAEFSKVVNGMKDTSIAEKSPVSRRPSGPQQTMSENFPPDTQSHDPQDAANKTEDKIIFSSDETTSPKPIPLGRCLFCNYDSPSLKLNVLHMSKFHGMFIPEQAYLVDLEGLIRYLHTKINQTFECLYCHKSKGSMNGIQTHMKDKGHCMIAFESEEEMLEVGQFYDFRSSYSDNEADDEDTAMEDPDGGSRGGVKLGGQVQALRTVIAGADCDEELHDGEENADGWETDSSASSLDTDELTAIPIDHTHAFERLPLHRHHSHNDPRPHRTVDGFHSHAHNHHAVFRSDYELYLPSGRTAGHRSLSRYYRQNLRNHPSPAERIERRMLVDADSDASSDDMAHATESRVVTRANGGSGMLGVTDSKKREVRAAEKRERGRDHRARQQYEWGVNKRANAQKHYRDPLLQ